MDTYSEEEISFGSDSDMLPCNQEPSSKSEDRKCCMEEKPDSDKWHTRRYRMCAALSFTDLPSRSAPPNNVCNSIHWNYETTTYRFTDDDTCSRIQYCHQYYSVKVMITLHLKMSH